LEGRIVESGVRARRAPRREGYEELRHATPPLNRPARSHGIRKEFPLLQQESHGKGLVYLDRRRRRSVPCRARRDGPLLRDHPRERARGVYAIAGRRPASSRWRGGPPAGSSTRAAGSEIVFRRTPPKRSTRRSLYGRHLLPKGKAILLTSSSTTPTSCLAMLAAERGSSSATFRSARIG